MLCGTNSPHTPRREGLGCLLFPIELTAFVRFTVRGGPWRYFRKMMMVNCTFEKPAHAVPLASARQRPENQKENQAGYSSERAVEGQLECGIALGA